MGLTIKEYYQGEAKTSTITITDESGSVIDVSTATLTLTVKERMSDTTALFTIADGSMDKSQAASGIVGVPFSASNLNRSGKIFAILKVEFSAANIKIGAFISLTTLFLMILFFSVSYKLNKNKG